jgi:hypothetical protein
VTTAVKTVTLVCMLAVGCDTTGGERATTPDDSSGGTGGSASGTSGGASGTGGGASGSDGSKFVGLWKAIRESADGPCDLEPTQWTPSSTFFPYVSFKIEGAAVQEYRCDADMSCNNGPLGLGTYQFVDGIWSGGLHQSASGSPPCKTGTDEYRLELRGTILRQLHRVQSAPGTEESGQCSFDPAGPYVCVSDSVTEFERVGP